MFSNGVMAIEFLIATFFGVVRKSTAVKSMNIVKIIPAAQLAKDLILNLLQAGQLELY